MAITKLWKWAGNISHDLRDSMLARIQAMALCPCLSICVCLSDCLSVTSRCFSKRDEQINLVFGMGASFDQSYSVF